MKATAHRQRAKDLLPRLEEPASDIEPAEVIASAHQQTGIDELTDLVGLLKVKAVNADRPVRGARRLLTHLSELPADTWADRWRLFEAGSPDGGDWRTAAYPAGTAAQLEVMASGLLGLIVLDVVRPSHRWMDGKRLHLAHVTTARDPDDAKLLQQQAESFDCTAAQVKVTIRMAGQIQAHTGKQLRQLTPDDLLALPNESGQRLPGVSNKGLAMLWRALHQLGWIEHESAILPNRLRRRGQLSCEELVRFHGVDGEQGQVLAEYLKHRSAGLDYSSRKSLARNVVKLFWKDLLNHHPDLENFAITKEQAEGWKQRVQFTEAGQRRNDRYPILFAVRGFYLDIAQWALQDPYWVKWVAPVPIYQSDLKGYAKARRQLTARQHQRTRERAPLLPQLVAQAENDRREATALLQAARDAGHLGSASFRGQDWTVTQATPTAQIRLLRDDEQINLTVMEDSAFWAWAIVETLRHTGARQEELLELSHLAIQPYKLPSTSETIPLLHIAPSKTDEERLLVAGPELVHVLAQVVNRIRGNEQTIPLTQRWDVHEKLLGPPLPHLFITRRNGDLRVMSPNTVAGHLQRVAERAQQAAGDQSIHFTPHDLRRIFATDALSSGLPPHIVQVLMGHKSLATTQGYAAIYPQDVIRHHRLFIDQRRRLRPSDEYREPSHAEWDEFEAHFAARKVSLGRCGRGFGTNCHHEHACLRCALLRPDPAQLDRLLEITANLKDRITEARDQGWLGEVEGLQISLTGAQHKLAQMQQQLNHSNEPVLLGLPSPNGPKPRP